MCVGFNSKSIETFSKNPVIIGAMINLPHKHDHKNLKGFPEISIKFR